MKSLMFSFLAFFVISLSATAQDSKKADKKEQRYQEILQIISSENYEFNGRSATTQKGRRIDLTTRGNYLRLRSGAAAADMPYFGRAFSGGYSSSDGGIKFDGPVENYEVKKNDKKRRLTIKFKVKGTDDTYTCTLSVSGKDNASLSVTSNKRQVITYIGEIRTLESN